MDIPMFTNGAISAAAHEYIPESGELALQVVVNLKLLELKETDTIDFTIKEPGICLFIYPFFKVPRR